MDETFLKEIKTVIEKQMDPFAFNKETLDEMEKIYETNKKYKKALLKIKIKDNKMEFMRDPSTKDKRMDDMIELFKRVNKYVEKNNKLLKDCIIYLYVAAVYTYEYQNLPFFVLSRPENRTGIVIPDNTFISYEVKGIQLDWDEQKDIIKSHCNMEKYEKINKLFFRGQNLGADKHNLRKLLERERKTNNFYDINVGSYVIPIYDNCKYKYLLNLPGDQPWSSRFKSLLLMRSLLIHVNVRQHYEYSENDGWITFFGQLIKDKVEYINVIYDWYENDPDKNKQSLHKLVNDIKEIYQYYEDNPDAYDDIINNGYKKINMITLDVVYETIYIIINRYAERFN